MAEKRDSQARWQKPCTPAEWTEPSCKPFGPRSTKRSPFSKSICAIKRNCSDTRGSSVYDSRAPVGEVDLAYTFSEAADFVVKTSTPILPPWDYAQAVDAHWIDVYPKKENAAGRLQQSAPDQAKPLYAELYRLLQQSHNPCPRTGTRLARPCASNEPFLNSISHAAG